MNAGPTLRSVELAYPTLKPSRWDVIPKPNHQSLVNEADLKQSSILNWFRIRSMPFNHRVKKTTQPQIGKKPIVSMAPGPRHTTKP